MTFSSSQSQFTTWWCHKWNQRENHISCPLHLSGWTSHWVTLLPVLEVHLIGVFVKCTSSLNIAWFEPQITWAQVVYWLFFHAILPHIIMIRSSPFLALLYRVLLLVYSLFVLQTTFDNAASRSSLSFPGHACLCSSFWSCKHFSASPILPVPRPVSP